MTISESLLHLQWRLVEDGRLVRLIYIDEAGTSPSETVRVVASVIVHADDQARMLVSEMEKVFDRHVPSHLRDGFHFHAKDIFNPNNNLKEKYNGWGFNERRDLIKDILRLPINFNIPIGLGITFKGYYDGLDDDALAVLEKRKISMATVEHGMAFAKCIERSDLFLRKYLDGKETGVVISEDVNEKKRYMQKAGLFFKDSPFDFPEDHQMQTQTQIAFNIKPKSYTEQITNILDVPHFVEKSGAPILQLADACAFSFRRGLLKLKYGDEFLTAMLGSEVGSEIANDPAWQSGHSSGLFNTWSYWSAEQKKDMKLQVLSGLAGKIFG